jgi:hypothetical protein
MLSLEELGKEIHDEVNKRFQDRVMPTESVSENFIHQIVLSIMEDLEEEGRIPFIPQFKVLNKTSMEERFSDNIPDFSKHINLVGLGKDTDYDQYGVMNVAFDGDHTERYQEEVDRTETPEPKESPEESNSSESRDQPSRSGEDDGVDIPDYLTVIEGGKSNK